MAGAQILLARSFHHIIGAAFIIRGDTLQKVSPRFLSARHTEAGRAPARRIPEAGQRRRDGIRTTALGELAIIFHSSEERAEASSGTSGFALCPDAPCGMRRRTLRQVLEYFPQSTIQYSARRPSVSPSGNPLSTQQENANKG